MAEQQVVTEGEVVSARPRLSGSILITGGSGYIGRALVRRAQRDGWDARFTVYSRDETKQAVMRERYPDVRYVLGDITDIRHLQDVMYGHQLVIHAAAVKYIPEAELNVQVCVDTNVDGSRAVMRAAQGVVDHVVALSTDKAVSPLNLYGATKMVMERLVVEADLRSRETRYTNVRYGNVIGSTGSVIPRFMSAIRQGKPIVLTDPLMTRFWINYDDAIDLICEAATPSLPKGLTIIPTPKAMTLGDLADACQVVADKPVELKIAGLRPGEKMHEELLNESESLRTRGEFGRNTFWLLPSGTMPSGDMPFVLSSENAARISEFVMVSAIQESERV